MNHAIQVFGRFATQNTFTERGQGSSHTALIEVQKSWSCGDAANFLGCMTQRKGAGIRTILFETFSDLLSTARARRHLTLAPQMTVQLHEFAEPGLEQP